MAEKKAQYAPPASQVDLEERLKNGNKSDKVLSTADSFEAPEDEGGRTYAVEGNDTKGYVGVSGEYATYANKTEAPLVADKGAEADVFKSFSEAQAKLESTGRLGGKSAEAEEEDEGEKSETTASTQASTGGTPPKTGN